MTRHPSNAAARGPLLRAAAFLLSALLLFSSGRAEAVPCASLGEALRLGRAAEESGAEKVSFILPAEVLLAPRPIHDDRGKKGEWDADDAVWNLLYAFPSVYKMSYAITPGKEGLRVDLCFYYRDGVRLLKSVRNGTGSALEGREAAALAAAQRIVRSVPDTLPPRERLLALCEALCDVLSFTDPRSAGEKEVKSCLCALVTGEANCQGYADAFFLTASLAGFEVRYRNGWTLAGESHTWNRVRLGDEWLDTDLTWMDRGDTADEKNLLMDENALREGHVPEEDALPPF